VKHTLILIRYGEIALKKQATRTYFENTLVRNIRAALQKHNITYTLKKERGRIYTYTSEIDQSIAVLQNIFGIISLSPAIQTDSNLDSIAALALTYVQNVLKKDNSFALRTTRTGMHTYTSQDASIYVGDSITKATHARVDLTHPDIELFIEIRNDTAFLFLNKLPGIGGMPYGTQGTVLALIDKLESLLAAWYLMKRGCSLIVVNTKVKNEKKIRSFLTNWNATPPIVTINAQGKKLYAFINDIAQDYTCFAMVIGHSLYTADPDALSQIKDYNTFMKLPVLHPLIALNTAAIETKCKELGIQL
jgi:thiamine biosynthesis protein ThiI